MTLPHLPAPAGAAALLARCPLTVVDLGSLGRPTRTAALAAADTELAAITGALPAGTTLMVTAPGAATNPPHLQVVAVGGPGYRTGLLDAESTRQPGMVVLTDLTPTVLGWRGQQVPSDWWVRRSPAPAGAPPPPLSQPDRPGHRGPGVAGTHTIFFWTYACWTRPLYRHRPGVLGGASQRAAAGPPVAGRRDVLPPRCRSARSWPTWCRGGAAHPAIWLYGLGWRGRGRSRWAGLATGIRSGRPARSALTVAVMGLDVITGSRLQMGTPFGLSVLEAGRFYGIGSEAVGMYAMCGIFAAAWAGHACCAGWSVPAVAGGRRCSPWGGRGVRGGGLRLAAVRRQGRRHHRHGARLHPAAHGPGPGTDHRPPGDRVLVSGLALFAVFALINYLVPATGHSDIGVFAGNLCTAGPVAC